MPKAEGLSEAFACLDRAGFPATSRLPLFAARHWSPTLERKALSRFRQGLDNVEEVAIPRWYWRGLPLAVKPLFRTLSLGIGPPPLDFAAPLTGLLDANGYARWRVVCRFGRYVLYSRPEVNDDSLVYFGDDTLFLMQSARDLLATFEGPVRFLDLCCGGGGVGLGLPPFRGQMVGVDINPAAIDLAGAVATAQGLSHYTYVCCDAAEALDGSFDLVVGNPPTLPPDLGGRATLFATGASSQFLHLLDRLLGVLSPRGRALFTVFSTAEGRGAKAYDPLRSDLSTTLASRRGHRYSVRRQFPLSGGRWLRHVALEILPQDAPQQQHFQDPARGGQQLPALAWRRQPL
jgi:SAM-dependent methyltransferase